MSTKFIIITTYILLIFSRNIFSGKNKVLQQTNLQKSLNDSEESPRGKRETVLPENPQDSTENQLKNIVDQLNNRSINFFAPITVKIFLTEPSVTRQEAKQLFNIHNHNSNVTITNISIDKCDEKKLYKVTAEIKIICDIEKQQKKWNKIYTKLFNNKTFIKKNSKAKL